ncbi:LamG domain-containing protein, partial [Verrucomicrobiota bacterium]
VEDGTSADRSPLWGDPVVALTFEGGIVNGGSLQAALGYRGVETAEGGRFGSAARFSGGACVWVPEVPITEEGTWCAWLRVDAEQAEPDVRIMDGNGYAFGISRARIYSQFHTDKMKILRGDNVPVGEWTHVAMTWQQGYVKLYFNGYVHDQGLYEGRPAEARKKVVIGARWTEKDKPFDGCLDDVCIFDRALRAEDIRTLMEAGLASGRES